MNKKNIIVFAVSIIASTLFWIISIYVTYTYLGIPKSSKGFILINLFIAYIFFRIAKKYLTENLNIK
jgi:hypothetical protein